MGAYDYKPPPAAAPKPKQDSSGSGGAGGANDASAGSGTGGAYSYKPPPAAPLPAGASGGVTSPANSDWVQRVRDFSDRLSNNFLLNMGDPIVSGVGKGASWIESSLGFQPSEAATAAANLPALRLQRAQMNQRMPTQDKAAADFIGQFNPTLPLRSIPAVGPIVQGAGQEAVKGWAQGESGPQIAKDALVGAAGGGFSGAMSTPEALGASLGTAVTAGGPAALGYLYGGKFDDVLGGMGGPAGAIASAGTGKYLLDPWNEAIKKAVSGSVPPLAAELTSYAPLAAASYWNQQQRDRATLQGQGQ